jgi:hypothetical protein
MSGLAQKMGLTLENNGVSGMKISNPYLWGSLVDQMHQLREAADIDAEVINGTTLYIAPKFTPRKQPAVVVAPPPLGQMVEYPVYIPLGVMVKNLFDPRISFQGSIEVHSSIVKTTTYKVLKLDHALDANIPHGQWMSTIEGYSPNAPQPVLPSR